MPTSPMWRLAVLAALGLFALAPVARAQPITAEQVATILASPDRTAADRTNDLRRLPQQLLYFYGVRPGITAVDLFAGGGYTTELVARAVGPSGAVFGQSRPPMANAPRPAQSEGNSNPLIVTPAPAAPPVFRPSPEALAARMERMRAAGVATAPISAVVRPFEDPFPAELAEAKVDMVTLIFNYHDLGHMGADRAAMNRAVFRALKPGGIYIIADHSGRAGTGITEAGTLHRIEEAFLRQEVEAAGFKLVAEGNFLRNPNDPRDKNTPDPAMPKDEFVLKFAKP